MTTRAPYSRAISQVRSVEPESTTRISSAQRTLASVRGRLDSSFRVTSAMERVLGIHAETTHVFSHAARFNRSDVLQELKKWRRSNPGLRAEDSRGRLSPCLGKLRSGSRD